MNHIEHFIEEIRKYSYKYIIIINPLFHKELIKGDTKAKTAVLVIPKLMADYFLMRPKIYKITENVFRKMTKHFYTHNRRSSPLANT